ncbi:MAG: hypothetical protein Q9207_005261 [Kuettlingeria erythrocarpa]
MWFPYAFTNPDEAGLHRRRHLLDRYGQVAQWSALIPLLALQVPFLFLRLKSYFNAPRFRAKVKEHASPVVERFGVLSVKTDETRNSVWNRMAWRLDQEVSPGWGTWRVFLVAALWTAWLFVLAVRDTGDDYLHLTKRFGIVAASQLPLHYLLALKSPLSPITLLTRLSHEELNPYHRALGRILLIFFSLHASFYLNFYIQKSLLLKRIRDRDVLLGLLAITSFLTLGTTALARIRRRNYLLFFIVHVALSISLLPTLYFHVSHLRVYILESALIYAILILQRNLSQTKVPSSTLTLLPSTSPPLISITIPLTPSLAKRTFRPGQHIYLALPTPPLTAPHEKLRLNPFTIANLPHQDKHIRLVIRALKGTTALISDLASKPPSPSPSSSPLQSPTTSPFPSPSAPSAPPPLPTTTTPLLLEGPYGSASHFPALPIYPAILLVAGGVGATFTLPIYRDLIERDNVPRGQITFVWSVKAVADAVWGMEYLREEGARVFVTRGHGSRRSDAAAAAAAAAREEENDDDVEGMELQERAGLMEHAEEDLTTTTTTTTTDSHEAERVERGIPNHITITRSRPNFAHIVNEIFTADPPPAKVAVLVCGPGGMGAALRREVGVWVGRGREVWWHGEEFGW